MVDDARDVLAVRTIVVVVDALHGDKPAGVLVLIDLRGRRRRQQED